MHTICGEWEFKLCWDSLYGGSDCRFCRQYYMVSCYSASCTYAFGYLYVVHQSFLLCTIQMHFGLQETHVIGCFLGAHVAVYYRSVRVQWGGESWVIGPNGVRRARTVHPFPLCRWIFKDWPPNPGFCTSDSRIQVEMRSVSHDGQLYRTCSHEDCGLHLAHSPHSGSNRAVHHKTVCRNDLSQSPPPSALYRSY